MLDNINKAWCSAFIYISRYKAGERTSIWHPALRTQQVSVTRAGQEPGQNPKPKVSSEINSSFAVD